MATGAPPSSLAEMITPFWSITEGDAGVSASTITNWYQEVYEPSYAAAAAASLDGEG